MAQAYVEFPTPDNSKILGLPIAPADNMTSLPTLISCVCPSGVLYSTARAWRGEGEDAAHRIRITVELVRTLKFGRST